MKTLYIKLKQLSFFISILCINSIVAEQENSTEYFKTQRIPRYSYSKVMFVKNNNDEEFVIKKHSDAETAIHEAACADILESVGVNTNRVKILPAHHPSIQKFTDYTNYTTTVHNVVPGIEIGRIKEMDEINIQPGLTKEETLKNIAQDKRLAPIVAANTYLDDRDGHNFNILFDKETNQFYTIDKEYAFSYFYGSSFCDPATLEYLSATQTGEFLSTLTKKQLSPEETKALKRMNKTLKKLIIQYPPKTLHDKWMSKAKEIDYEYSPEKKEYMSKFLEHNFNENKRISYQLNLLIKRPFSVDYVSRRLANPTKYAQRDFWHTMNS